MTETEDEVVLPYFLQLISTVPLDMLTANTIKCT